MSELQDIFLSICNQPSPEDYLSEGCGCREIILSQFGFCVPNQECFKSNFQIPEPWTGCTSAPIVFVAKNPSISLTRTECFPNRAFQCVRRSVKHECIIDKVKRATQSDDEDQLLRKFFETRYLYMSYKDAAQTIRRYAKWVGEFIQYYFNHVDEYDKELCWRLFANLALTTDLVHYKSQASIGVKETLSCPIHGKKYTEDLENILKQIKGCVIISMGDKELDKIVLDTDFDNETTKHIVINKPQRGWKSFKKLEEQEKQELKLIFKQWLNKNPNFIRELDNLLKYS